MRIIFLALFGLSACVHGPEAQRAACDPDAAAAALLAAHAEILRAHRDDDVDAWMVLEPEVQIVGSAGRVVRVAAAERRAGREAYLAGAEFERYEDAVAPVVRVAGDCSLGWVMVEVVATGVSRTADGAEEPIDWRASWVELYARADDGWKMIGNVSNFAD